MNKLINFLNNYKIFFEIFQTIGLGTMGLIISFIGLKLNKRAVVISEKLYTYQRFSGKPLFVWSESPSGIINVGAPIKEGAAFIFSPVIRTLDFVIPLDEPNREDFTLYNTQINMFNIERMDYNKYDKDIVKIVLYLSNYTKYYYDITMDFCISYTDEMGGLSLDNHLYRLSYKSKNILPINSLSDDETNFNCDEINLDTVHKLYEGRPESWELDLEKYLNEICGKAKEKKYGTEN